MARLVAKSDGSWNQVIELHLGLNRLGRGPKNHFQIEHPSVSTFHCEIRLAEGEVTVRDCESTNGITLNGRRIKEASLQTGQTLCLGEVELFVESTDVTIAIPKFEVERPAPPVVLSDGSMLCPRHPKAQATHQCTYCLEILCDACVHRLRRRGGKVLKLCPICSHKCEPIGGEKKRKKNLLQFFRKTVKLPFGAGKKTEEPE
jgi:hypothetical protein